MPGPPSAPGAVRPLGPGPRLASNGEPVIPAMPFSMSTVGAPIRIGAGPPVVSETISLSVPGSLPWTALKPPPTVPILAPPILVFEVGPMMPPAEVPETGYGTGIGAGAAGVVQTEGAMGVTT